MLSLETFYTPVSRWAVLCHVIRYGGAGRASTQVSHDNFSSVYWIFWPHDSPVEGGTLFILGSLGQRSNPINIILTTGSFPHDNFSSIYWIFTTLGHQIPLWKGKNPIYFGVISSKIKVTVTMEHFISIEPLLRGHLSYKATFSLFQR